MRHRTSGNFRAQAEVHWDRNSSTVDPYVARQAMHRTLHGMRICELGATHGIPLPIHRSPAAGRVPWIPAWALLFRGFFSGTLPPRACAQSSLVSGAGTARTSMSGKHLAREHAVASRRGRPASASRGPALLTSWHSSGHRAACRLRAPPRVSRPTPFSTKRRLAGESRRRRSHGPLLRGHARG